MTISPMLDKDLYDSWKSRMELYMQNREHRRMILESVEHGPLIWPTVEENSVIRTKKYAELSAAEKIQADCDIKATNIILQGLPADIYSLVNHDRVAKDLWERVQLLMQCTSLTKQERECKLYNAFDKFTHIKGESLHMYYLRFTQLINDMNIYKMKNGSTIQVITKSLTVFHLNGVIVDNNDSICLSQGKYCLEILHEFGLLAGKHVDTPLPGNATLNHTESDDDHLLVNVSNYQRLVGLSREWSSAKAEYRSMASATCEVIWLSNLLGEMGVKNLLPVVMYCDNSFALQIAANPVFHEKSKHFEIDVHLVREKVASGVIKTEKIHTTQQIADILTKGLDIEQHKILCGKLRMLDMFKLEKA
ncbi:hypothetical protein Tco_0710054 [Tanacetum coccineum]